MVNTAKNFLITLNNLQQMHLKLLQKESFKKQQKQLVIWLVTKLLIELRKSQEVYHRIIQKKLQTNMIKKYLKKDIYLQKKSRKLLMIWDNIIVKQWDIKNNNVTKIINFLDNKPNQPFRFKTKKLGRNIWWIKRNI